MKTTKNDSLFTICTDCHSCTERCIVKIATPGSLRIGCRAQKSVEHRPNPVVGELIERYWQVPRYDGTAQRAFEILPHGRFDLVLVLADRFCKLILMGPFTRKVFLPIRNSVEYFCIRFRPGQVPRLADIRPAELVDNAIYLPKLFGIAPDMLGEQLYALTDVDSRRRFIEDLFREVRPESNTPTKQFRRLAERVTSLEGQIRVEALAEGSGISLRTVERLFKDEVGIPPKTFIRFVRFQNAVEKLRNGNYATLAEIAYACGYADQSHFIKDFKHLFNGLPGFAASTSSVVFLQYEMSEPV